MNIFNKNTKTKLPFITIEHLIEETSKNTLPTIMDTLNRTGFSIDELNAKTNILALNYEIARYELYKGNERSVVDEVINDLYDGLQYLLNISSEYRLKYEEIISKVKKVSKEMFDVKHLQAPRERYVYRLLLEQLSIREDNLSKEIIPEIVFYAKSWIDNMANINSTYSVDTSDEGRKNDTIDFKF